jgi:hypothetical protein
MATNTLRPEPTFTPPAGGSTILTLIAITPGPDLELVVCEVIVDGICRQPVNVSVLQVSNGSSSQRVSFAFMMWAGAADVRPSR